MLKSHYCPVPVVLLTLLGGVCAQDKPGALVPTARVKAAEKVGKPASGTTFVLHKGLKPGAPLKTCSYSDAVHYIMGSVESHSQKEVRMIRPYFNPFILMLHVGFATHRPIVISPDTIWLLICNGFATHAESQGMDLQKQLYPLRPAADKVVLKVRMDDFRKGRQNPWDQVFHSFTTQMGDMMAKGVKATLTDPFSTTGGVEQAAFHVAFMKTMSKSFDYQVFTFCGIPAITLEGTTLDWEAVAKRAEGLRGYGCDKWLDIMKPVLAQFVAASRGHVDHDFWCSIYKHRSASGGSTIDGWCLVFFPYRDGFSATMLAGLKKDSATIKRDTRRFHHTRPGSLPMTVSQVPFSWTYFKCKYKMRIQAGFVGVSVAPGTELLRAEIGWGVGEATLPKKDQKAGKRRNAAQDMVRQLGIRL